jgi:hypothetical protein
MAGADHGPHPSGKPGARVTITTYPLWRIRVARELARYLLGALALAGVLASLRFAVDPPAAVLPASSEEPIQPDLAAQGFATLFARRYLTWQAQEPEAHRQALEPFVGQGIEPDAGMQPPTSGEQHVQWAEVVQARALGHSEHIYTVAAQTDAAGLLYLTVAVAREPDGRLTLAAYPAFIGAPSSGPAAGASEDLKEVQDQALATVVRRALSNYLAPSPAELAADLTSDAHVSLPVVGLSLESIVHLRWSPGYGAVIATVLATDPRGARYTLEYELDVTRRAARWEISAIQMSPDA